MNCVDCGEALPPYSGIGRPRKRSADCAEPGTVARRWRAQHPDLVEQYNAARRTGWTLTPAQRAALRRGRRESVS
jgi:hypothetical protein